MIRSVFVHFNIVFGYLFCMFPQLLFALSESSGNWSHGVGRLWGHWILFCSGVRVKVRGRENIVREGPQIFFCNHNSYFDVFTLLSHLPAQYRWLAREELFHLPLFGTSMHKAGYVPINRSNSREAYRSVVAAADRVKNGTSLAIFPEGTRSPDGRLQPFKTGGSILAIKAQVPVVPVAILGTDRILPKGTFRLGPGRRVEIRIGQAIPTEGLHTRDKMQLTEQVRDRIKELLEAPPMLFAEAAGEIEGRFAETNDVKSA
jgi:1-acyl-sn-glycerol-3-phosphate acyltransferase